MNCDRLFASMCISERLLAVAATAPTQEAGNTVAFDLLKLSNNASKRPHSGDDATCWICSDAACTKAKSCLQSSKALHFSAASSPGSSCDDRADMKPASFLVQENIKATPTA
eukprot:1556587-Pyramimonas_sp.AAC.2